MRRLLVASVCFALVVAGCKEKPRPPADLPGTTGLDLASSVATEKAPAAQDYPNAVVVYNTIDGLELDNRILLPPPSRPSEGFYGSDKPDGGNYSLFRLEAALRGKDPTTALLAFDGATTYRVVAEIVFTLSQSKRTKLEFLVQSGTGERRVFRILLPQTGGPCDVPMPTAKPAQHLWELQGALAGSAVPPKPPRTALASRPALCLTFATSARGVTVRSHGDLLDATCIEFAATDDPSTPTFASGDGKLPISAIMKCTTAMRTRSPAAASDRVIVSATSETAWRDVVALLDIVGPTAGFGEPLLGSAD